MSASDDLDVDALVAELDDLLHSPAGKSKSNGGPHAQSHTGSRPASKPASASAFRPAAAATVPSTGTSAFDLSSDDDEPLPRSRASSVQAAKPTSQASVQPRAAAAAPKSGLAANFDDSDDDINNLIADMDSAISQPQRPPSRSPTSVSPVASVVSQSQSQPRTSAFGAGSKVKCYPPILSSGTPGSVDSCASLLCVSCDQRVIFASRSRFNESVEYMFFRNHYPDLQRMRNDGGLVASATCTAFACACSWQSVGIEASGNDTIDLSAMHRVPQRDRPTTSDGCSDWDTLKWVCTGH